VLPGGGPAIPAGAAVSRLSPDNPLAQVLRGLLAPAGTALAGELTRETLPSSREVCRFTFGDSGYAVVAKFFTAYPPAAPSDQGLAQEYGNYLRAAALGLKDGCPRIPRLLGRHPENCLGLWLEAIPGPDLDGLIQQACLRGEAAALHQGLASLAELLAFFHSRPVPEAPVSGLEGLGYLDKLRLQLHRLGLLDFEDEAALAAERCAWEDRLSRFPDRRVLVHGDATPTNFLFPDHRAVALDLERLRFADRLWDLSWVAGELKHAWAWRTGHPTGAEGAIGHFFAAYLAALPVGPGLAERLLLLNPFYMALAELRIARNVYLSWDHRRWLVAEARRCLSFGRNL
jgi:aminoglycoside phosphotransferase